MVAEETTPIRERLRLPPLIPYRYSPSRPNSNIQMKDDSDSRSSDNDNNCGIQHHRTLFVCGFVPKRWHNSSLQSVIIDLLPHYYVACNDEKWGDDSNSRDLLANADGVLFFVNEFTLGDTNCLLTLQYAWHLMIPIIMLRPPRTKLVICKRDDRRDDIRVIANGSIIRSPSTRWALIDHTAIDSVDYNLLQDVLYEGYKMSVVYDRLDHKKSMTKIKERVDRVLKPTNLGLSPDKVGFYLSPSNESNSSTSLSVMRKAKTKGKGSGSGRDSLTPQQVRLSQSMNNLDSTPKKKKKERHPGTPRKKRKNVVQVPPLRTDTFDEDELQKEEDAAVSQIVRRDSTDRSYDSHVLTGNRSTYTSRTSSIERRMSMSSLDDQNNYTQTQYLVFPLRDPSKRPTLVKFPEDLLEEQYHEGSVWGSDTSLEEEAEIAPKINGGMSFDVDDSPIQSPAPYIDPI